MTASSDDVLETVRNAQESLDTLSVSDVQGWQELAETLAALEERFEGPQREASALTALCRLGIICLWRETSADRVSLVDGIYSALNACEMFLQADAADVAALQKSVAALSQILDESVDTGAVVNGIAADLIQLEAGDRRGLKCLFGDIGAVTCCGMLPPPAHAHLEKAHARIGRFLYDGEEDDALFDDLGEIVQNALDAMEDLQRGMEPAGMHKEGSAAGGSSSVPAAPPAAAPAAKQGVDGDTAPPAVETGTATAEDFMPADADPELVGEFITEGSELIANAEDALLQLEVDPEDSDAVGTVFRAFHTIKGTAAFMELDLVSEMAHHAESLLSRVRDGEIRYSGGYADLSLNALDMLKELITSVQAALEGNPLAKPEGYDRLLHVLANPEAAGISESAADVEAPRVGDLLVAQGKAEREAVEAAVADHRGEKAGTALVKSGTANARDVGQALRMQKRINGPKKFTESSVRVSTSRLDKLIDMVGEMVIAHSMVAQDELVVRAENHELQKKVVHTSKIVRELQDLSMSMRMVPLKATFSKMARLVRDLSHKQGKQVNLVTEGEDTEIDRNLVDIVNDPLVHMVRNAVDHGIEPPEVRTACGKPPAGTVRLLAYHSAGSVVVEIRDDGKGLDRDRILEKARQRGLVEDSCAMGDRDIFNLIFEPGFSTAETVTDVSGRGVGMDVVKKNIESLRGQVEIQSEAGRGSIFKMRLPLTLAIIDGMVVGVGLQKYIIPTVSIVRLIKPEAQNLSSVFKQEKMLMQNGRLIPLFSLAELYGIERDMDVAESSLVVVIEDDGQQAGLVIEELFGRQQVVIKTLGETMQDVPGISGGAILPNGRVGLIVDVGGVIRLATAAGVARSAGGTGEDAVCYG